MIHLNDEDQLKKIGVGLIVGGVVVGSVALVAYTKGYNKHVKLIDQSMIDIAKEVSDGGAKTANLVRNSGEKLNILFFGENGVPKETIKYLKSVGKEALQ